MESLGSFGLRKSGFPGSPTGAMLPTTDAPKLLSPAIGALIIRIGFWGFLIKEGSINKIGLPSYGNLK